VSWAWWDWPLTWLTNHCPTVLWHCWLGHLTRKIVSGMTYNVSSGTLNPTTPYHRPPGRHNKVQTNCSRSTVRTSANTSAIPVKLVSSEVNMIRDWTVNDACRLWQMVAALETSLYHFIPSIQCCDWLTIELDVVMDDFKISKLDRFWFDFLKKI